MKKHSENPPLPPRERAGVRADLGNTSESHPTTNRSPQRERDHPEASKIWITAILFSVLFAALPLARREGRGVEDRSTAAAQQPASAFTTVRIHIDSGRRPLAAYQFEMTAGHPGVKIVGVEGGEHPAFRRPPRYDPAAMSNERIIAAAFSTRDPADLPVGRTRVATIHVRLPDGAAPDFQLRLTAAADADGHPIDAEVSITKGSG